MSAEQERKIAELESALRATKARVAALEHRLAGLLDPDGARQMHGNFEMPGAAEMRALHRVVLGELPMLRADPEVFAAAFQFVASLSRSNKMSAFANVTWIDRMCEWARARQLPEPNLAAFVAALLAHGDVEHTVTALRFPYDLNYSLTTGAHRLPTGDGWKAVLASGTLRPASKLPVPAQRATMQLMLTGQ